MGNMKLQYQLSNGSWANGQDRFEHFIQRAIDENKRRNEFDADKFPVQTREEIIAQLESGATIAIGTDWYSEIRSGSANEAKMEKRRAAQNPVEMVKCSCGHTVPKGSVMMASRGTSCPDCYDKMSD